MSHEPYPERLMDHYRHPRNYGTIKNPDFSCKQENSSCGDSVSFKGKIKNNVITEIAFEGNGCAISIASASLLSEFVLNKTIDEVLAINKDSLLNLIGIHLGPLRIRCALLPLMTLQQALIDYKKKRG